MSTDLRKLIERSAGRGWRMTICAAAAMLALPALSTPASAANFFEKLFGVRQQPAVAAPAPPQVAPLVKIPLRAGQVQGQKAKPKAVKTRPSGPSVRQVAARPEVLPGPLGPFLLDPTLRRGDVVVTTDGLKVFTGQGNSQHSQGDFMALAQANRFVAGNSSVLMAIDRANRFSARPLVEVIPAQPAKGGAAPELAAKPGRQAAIAGASAAR